MCSDGLTYERSALAAHVAKHGFVSPGASAACRCALAQPSPLSVTLKPIARERYRNLALLAQVRASERARMRLSVAFQIRMRFTAHDRALQALDFDWVFRDVVLRQIFLLCGLCKRSLRLLKRYHDARFIQPTLKLC